MKSNQNSRALICCLWFYHFVCVNRMQNDETRVSIPIVGVCCHDNNISSYIISLTLLPMIPPVLFHCRILFSTRTYPKAFVFFSLITIYFIYYIDYIAKKTSGMIENMQLISQLVFLCGRHLVRLQYSTYYSI